jgi:hypothetical protein
MAGAWGCPHEINGQCHKVIGQACDPGMKGCVLSGRYVFASAGKNQRLLQKQARRSEDSTTQAAKPDDQPRE